MILIQNIMNGDQAAQEIFYNRYRKIIKNYLMCKYATQYFHNIDDWVSDVLIRVLYNLKKYNPEKSTFKTWVLAIAKNYLYDNLRKKSNTHLLYSYMSETDTTDNVYNVSSSNTALDSGNEFENIDSINFISTQLSVSDYTLLNMKYVQGYDYEEIGKEFNVSSSTISNKVNYIKTKLKKNYSEMMVD